MESKTSTWLLVDKLEEIHIKEEPKAAVIRQEGVVQVRTKIAIRITNNRITIILSILAEVVPLSIKKVVAAVLAIRVHQDSKEIKISFHHSTSVIQIILWNKIFD